MSNIFANLRTYSSRAVHASALLSALAVLLCSAGMARAQSPLGGFDPNANGTVNAIAVQADGKILIGGNFTSLAPNGGAAVARNGIARLNTDGTVDASFDPNAHSSNGNSGTVNAIVVQADGKILIGGGFSTLMPNGGSPVARNNIARLNTDGTVDASFNPNADAVVQSIVVQADGKILVCGFFSTFTPNGGSSVSRFSIARLNADGTVDGSFNPNINVDVYSIVVQADGKILVGGFFNTLAPNGGPTVTRNKIARLNADGTLDGGQLADSVFNFSQAPYTVSERDGSVTITVRRTGHASQPASVAYATDDGRSPLVNVLCSEVAGMALERCDYTRSAGTLSWAAGDTSDKTFVVLVNDDSYTEGTETTSLRLSNPVGAALGPQSSATLQITDDAQQTSNPVDDPTFFVTQHYHDFLNRVPDPSGLQFWTGGITGCGADSNCGAVKRVDTSAAFFLSIEFQQTGYLVERVYKAAFGDATGNSTFPARTRSRCRWCASRSSLRTRRRSGRAWSSARATGRLSLRTTRTPSLESSSRVSGSPRPTRRR